ncbi:MAG: hypothetical protein Greene101449_660 [Candidatus Peregrinibacteria bacterium Greene1014_49]|nr:MAG: hypothetical protein Greene101449_660 [Candidatus Peregrinibacteria bacterium Greene1014_49]
MEHSTPEKPVTTAIHGATTVVHLRVSWSIWPQLPPHSAVATASSPSAKVVMTAIPLPATVVMHFVAGSVANNALPLINATPVSAMQRRSVSGARVVMPVPAASAHRMAIANGHSLLRHKSLDAVCAATAYSALRKNVMTAIPASCSARCFFDQGSCGDGLIQRALDEACEPALMPTSTLPYRCDSITCRYVSISCGDNHLDLGEACDSGKLNADLPGSPCRSDCNAPRCGDGIRDPDETCDDGNMLDSDICPSTCGSTSLIAGVSEVAGMNIPFPGFHGTPDALGRVLGSYSLDPITGEPIHPTYPSVPGTQVLPWQLPLASVQQTATGRAPAGGCWSRSWFFLGSSATESTSLEVMSGVEGLGLLRGAWMWRKRKRT